MRNKGITIIALVITIILLIILAGITINLTIGENGLFSITKKAKKDYEQAKIEEETFLNNLYDEMILGSASEGNSSDAILKMIEFKKAIAKAITEQNVETLEEETIDKMAENIGKILSARTNDATATAKDLSKGKTAYANGEKIEGSTGDTIIEDELQAIPLKEKYYLYNAGNKYSEITGGWTVGYNPGYTTLIFQDTYMQFVSKIGNDAGSINTVNGIDMSGYSRLYFEIEELRGHFGVTSNPSYRLTQANNGAATILINSSCYREILENGHDLYWVDIQDIKGKQYPVLDNYMGTTNIYSVYLR